jgi:hypothetical protein
MNANKTVTAYFMKVYSFSTSTSPADAGTISPSTGLRDAGTKVTLTATAKFPYAFTYWTGTDNDNVNPTTITMNSDISATAYFIKLSPGSAQTQPGKLWGQVVSIPIQLEAGQWMQGEISATQNDIAAHIQDPNGQVVKELGRLRQTTFSFQAQSNGTFVFVIYKSYDILYNYYTLTYTIYS